MLPVQIQQQKHKKRLLSKINYKDTRMTSMTSFWCLYCCLLTYCNPFSSVSIDLEVGKCLLDFNLTGHEMNFGHLQDVPYMCICSRQNQNVQGMSSLTPLWKSIVKLIFKVQKTVQSCPLLAFITGKLNSKFQIGVAGTPTMLQSSPYKMFLRIHDMPLFCFPILSMAFRTEN